MDKITRIINKLVESPEILVIYTEDSVDVLRYKSLTLRSKAGVISLDINGKDISINRENSQILEKLFSDILRKDLLDELDDLLSIY